MKIILKTLKRESFPLEVEPGDSILKVKQKIEQQYKHPVSWQKLIFSGQILSETAILSSYNIKESDFIVLMVKKPKEEEVKSPPTTTPTPSERTDTLPPKPTTEHKESPPPSSTGESEKKSPPETATLSSGGESQKPTVDTAASALVTGSDYEQIVKNIIELGFPRDQVVAAMKASFNNPDRAVEYLYQGIPATVTAPQTQDPQEGGEDTGEDAGEDSGESEGVFDFLRQHPQFNQLRQAIRANPQLLQTVIQQLVAANPQMLPLLTQHQEEFVRLLNEPGPGTGPGTGPSVSGLGGPSSPQAPPGVRYIQVTQEEKGAIDRLVNLGFERSKVIEAYFACDKDEQLAANYLAEHGREEDLDGGDTDN